MDLFTHITPHTTVLTPNRRLSAAFAKNYAQWQLSQDKTCWPTLDILPLYPSWLERLWKDYCASTIEENVTLLTTHQEQILWEKILRDAPENESLLQISDTAKLAKSAWETLKRWEIDLNDHNLKLTEDSRAFLHWATEFKTLCKKKHWLDLNSLTDIIINKIMNNKIKVPKHLLLVGFTEIAPQYQHLLKTCAEVGSKIDHYKIASCNQTTYSIGLTDTETEILTMARWAKSQLEKSNSIACIIPSLETLRESALKIFNDVFGEKNFNISAGKTLISYPIIHDALLLLNLNSKSISSTTLSALLRSPFVGDAERERYKRATYDVRLRNSNLTSITLNDLVNPDVKHNIIQSCPLFAKRITAFLAQLHLHDKLLPISDWIKVFADLLTQLGWPGERSLSSHEYQVVQNSWLPLLNEYATFDFILGPQNYQKALHYLTCLINSTVFQPESPETPVQILGLLEAAELPFDASWIMGLDDTVWPARAKPNPFIPLRMQKALQMPNASAERELIYCQELTKQLQQSTQSVIFSYPLQRDDAQLRPSALLKNYSSITLEQLTLSTHTVPAENIYRTQQLDVFQDNMAPSISETEKIRGGVKIFKAQAECPFKAFAEIRLHARKMEDTTLGLRKLDRGNMVHKALELIWRELHDSTTLIMMPDVDLKNLIQRCAAQAIRMIVESKQENNLRYLALEQQRLEKLLWDWLQVEKQRPAFTVVALEQEITTTIGNITASFRVDRIDELTSETTQANQLIIDYKTGKEIDKNDWFGERLEEPQLPIYCIANPDETAGIAFAKVNPNKIELIGASKNPLNMATIQPLADIKAADATLWNEQIRIWQTHLAQLGDNFYQGKAEVDPRDVIQTCRLCGLQPLCRIHEITNVDDDYDHEPL
ncbi:MAG: PD-(D/E)XK nuclease family protein [Gammaproteobacteria bacterium]